jgi:hypothetical protein
LKAFSLDQWLPPRSNRDTWLTLAEPVFFQTASARANMPSGSLTVVGTGIRLDHMTMEARAFIENAQKVLYLVPDPVTSSWIREVSPGAESLHDCYGQNKRRLASYLEMVERILSYLRTGVDLCVAFYGHPGIFVYPSHEAIRRARREGFRARMVPGISALDCLFADLGVDPGTAGCQSFEATDFLVYNRKFDTSSSLILWQIGVTGDLGCKLECNVGALSVLSRVLQRLYGPTHETFVYEAAQYPTCDPLIQRVLLKDLPRARVSQVSTLYVPPKRTVYPDCKMLDRLGIPRSLVKKKVPRQDSLGRSPAAKGHSAATN